MATAMAVAETQSVTIVEVCRVAPPVAESSAPKCVPLTLFDLFWIRKLPVQRLFFYEYPSPNTQFLLDSIVPKLKHSLSLTLHHFLPLAGNLIWPQDSYKPLLNYVEGDGVSLTIAESSSKEFFHDLCSNDFREATQCQHLLPSLLVSQDRAAAMALQVTVFPNSGFCVGITTHHAALDGRTSTSFMKSWAFICKAITESSSSSSSSPPYSIPELLTPIYDRTVIEGLAELEAIFVNAWLKQNGPDNRSLMLMDELPVPPGSARATFELSRNDIEKLRKYVSDHNSKNRPLRLSTFSLASGYIWFCSAKSLGVIKGQKSLFVFAADSRSRLKPAIPSTYFGNCVVMGKAFAEADDVLGEDGVVSAVEAISEAVRGLDDINDVFNGIKSLASFIVPDDSQKTSNETRVGVVGSNRFEVYSTDFGWGRPKKVEMTSIDRAGAISMSECRNGNGGVEIGLVLSMEKMEAFASAFARGLEAL